MGRRWGGCLRRTGACPVSTSSDCSIYHVHRYGYTRGRVVCAASPDAKCVLSPVAVLFAQDTQRDSLGFDGLLGLCGYACVGSADWSFWSVRNTDGGCFDGERLYVPVLSGFIEGLRACICGLVDDRALTYLRMDKFIRLDHCHI
ncbi:hypothetical protein FA13DRAFT_608063 [Coprinellus micaceus]|uniref:Uncharacterized protein n=1 Tax=Coprinellus micaceus TaxID=71717 RepID=A0A4Y7SAU7_COPMI|nr:hypothetical protein FA13DRAFT_608063 [Coprinellus micaceus]